MAHPERCSIGMYEWEVVWIFRMFLIKVIGKKDERCDEGRVISILTMATFIARFNTRKCLTQCSAIVYHLPNAYPTDTKIPIICD